MDGETAELEMVVSCAVVSAHWLMSEAPPDGLGPKCLSTALRERFEIGEYPDRDLIDWVIAICGVFIIYATVAADRRATFIAGLANATTLTGVLEPEAAVLGAFLGAGTLDLGDPRTAQLLRTGSALLARCLPEEDMCTVDPIMFAVMIEKANAFIASGGEGSDGVVSDSDAAHEATTATSH